MSAPSLTLAEAARLTGLSQSTLRRRRPQLTELGAEQTAQGWSIPIPALVSLGLMKPTTPPDAVVTDDSPVTPVVDALRLEVEQLRAELAAERQRAAVAEAIAVERDRLIDYLRAVDAPTTTAHGEQATTAPAAAPEAAQPTPTPRRTWWPFRQH